MVRGKCLLSILDLATVTRFRNQVLWRQLVFLWYRRS